MRTLAFLLRKEFLQITRDHVLMRMILIMPLIQLLLLANAVTFEVRTARMAVLDQDRSSVSRGVVERLLASGRFERTLAPRSRGEADEAMLRRRVDLILVLPDGLEEGLVRTGSAPVQVVINAEDGGAAAVIHSYLTRILEDFARDLAGRTLPAQIVVETRPEPPPAPGRAAIELRRRGWYNPEMDYRDYMVPGILVVLVTMIGTLLTAMNIVREKEAGTLEQLNVTPVRPSVFITAKLIPLWAFALLDLALGLAFAHYVLGVPVRGSLLLVFFSAGVYLVLALGIGLWVSTLVETQQQAMFVTYALLMVYLLMSGLFTPVRAMPGWAQWLAEANPVAHFVYLMRAVLLKGAGVADVARPLLLLAAGGAGVLALAVRHYRKRTA